MYRVKWSIYLSTFLLPFIGFFFGYVVAWILRQDPVKCRTIALETGIQNFPLCMTLLTLTFSKEKFAQISLCPLLYGVTSIICSCVFLGIYRLIERVQKSRKGSTNGNSRTPPDKETDSPLELTKFEVKNSVWISVPKLFWGLPPIFCLQNSLTLIFSSLHCIECVE